MGVAAGGTGSGVDAALPAFPAQVRQAVTDALACVVDDLLLGDAVTDALVRRVLDAVEAHSCSGTPPGGCTESGLSALTTPSRRSLCSSLPEPLGVRAAAPSPAAAATAGFVSVLNATVSPAGVASPSLEGILQSASFDSVDDVPDALDAPPVTLHKLHLLCHFLLHALTRAAADATASIAQRCVEAMVWLVCTSPPPYNLQCQLHVVAALLYCGLHNVDWMLNVPSSTALALMLRHLRRCTGACVASHSHVIRMSFACHSHVTSACHQRVICHIICSLHRYPGDGQPGWAITRRTWCRRRGYRLRRRQQRH